MFLKSLKIPLKTRALQFKAKKGKDTRSAPESPVIYLLFSHSSLYSPCSAFGRLKAWSLDRKGSSEAGSQICSNMEGALDDKYKDRHLRPDCTTYWFKKNDTQKKPLTNPSFSLAS